jgi:hypothetical protein
MAATARMATHSDPGLSAAVPQDVGLPAATWPDAHVAALQYAYLERQVVGGSNG